MKKNQLKFFPLYVTFKSKAVSQKMADSSNEEKKMTGFSLNWFLEDINSNQLTEKLLPRQENWKQEGPTPEYERTLLREMTQLARQLRLQNLTKDEISEIAVQQKMKGVMTNIFL